MYSCAAAKHRWCVFSKFYQELYDYNVARFWFLAALEYTGGVPYDIIKPILERASPDQLLNMEHFNPYLIEDTDHLWSQHCNRKFRTQKRQEYESWREMFCRCTDEQASRLSHLTKNIKLSQTIAVPLKQTKITFVDSVVKPPRDVIKKQVSW